MGLFCIGDGEHRQKMSMLAVDIPRAAQVNVQNRFAVLLAQIMAAVAD